MPPAEKEFVLTHVIKNLSIMKEATSYFSLEEEYFGALWKTCYYRRSGFLGLYLFCESKKREKWLIETQFGLKLLSANGMTIFKTKTANFGSSAGKEITYWGWNEFISWADLKKNYVIDDKVTIEAHVKILKMTGIEKKKLRNFDESVQELSDMTLIVKDEKFYVSKLFLAGQSSYFYALFMRGFKESKKSEITLTDVDSDQFQNFLEVLYGEPAIDDSTITGILQLADMYDTQTVIRRCEEFLMEKSEKTLKEKLEISAGFDLKKSTNKCLLEIKTAQDIKSVVSGNLSKMDPSVMAALLQKTLSLL